MSLTKETAEVRQSIKRYYWTLGPATVLYVVGLLVGLFIVEGGSTASRLLWSAVPIVGVVWMAASMVALYRRSDEMMRLAMVRSGAAGFLVGIPALAIGGIVYAFLDAPIDDLAIWGPFTLGVATWAIAWMRQQKLCLI